MARKRPDNKKWQSRSSRKKPRKNRTTKPCKIRKNNSKPSRPTKPSRKRRKKVDREKNCAIATINLEENLTEEVFDAQIIHNFLSERYVELMCNLVVSIVEI